MKKHNTPSFILELEISFSSALLNRVDPKKDKHNQPVLRKAGTTEYLERQLDAATVVYNPVLNEAMRRVHILQHDRSYLAAKKEYAACRNADRDIPKDVTAAMNDAVSRAEFTEYDLHAYAAKVKNYLNSTLGIDECQKLASRAYSAAKKVLSGEAKKASFRRRKDPGSVEGKSDRSTLKYIGHQCIQFGKGHVYPLIVKKNDVYAREALTHRVKYVRVVKKVIRGRARYFAQLVLEGVPPMRKNLTYAAPGNKMGIDIGVSTAAVVTGNRVSLTELAPDTQNDEKELRRLNRAIDRSDRAMNPDNYNPDGTVKKGRRKWTHSRRCLKLKARRKELYRVNAERRKTTHSAFANYLISQSTDIRVEAMSFRGLARKSKKISVNRKNGRLRSRKRYGKAVLSRAPAMLVSIIDRKLGYIGLGIKKVDTVKVKASQYDHTSGQYRKKSLSERFARLSDGSVVQRDLYSAFLLMNTDDSLDSINRGACCTGFAYFKYLQDMEVSRIRKLSNSHLRWYAA